MNVAVEIDFGLRKTERTMIQQAMMTHRFRDAVFRLKRKVELVKQFPSVGHRLSIRKLLLTNP